MGRAIAGAAALTLLLGGAGCEDGDGSNRAPGGGSPSAIGTSAGVGSGGTSSSSTGDPGGTSTGTTDGSSSTGPGAPTGGTGTGVGGNVGSGGGSADVDALLQSQQDFFDESCACAGLSEAECASESPINLDNTDCLTAAVQGASADDKESISCAAEFFTEHASCLRNSDCSDDAVEGCFDRGLDNIDSSCGEPSIATQNALTKCGGPTFECDNGLLIPSDWECDLFDDCDGGEDEADCGF